eukprot:CAMPEP_0183587336 /NCGR_PEP_ID=MMETSP0371-20130417/158774_1 /TAXON_ID=268820 /ORGANISM="Peridinium aciculiferum, Strain PAER-2" /LENGTH=89 /DNA_ID=CAMNT_0025798503 /DNA_START=94 /DNA_END=360 /DNA_ORIENTATION=+
MPHDPSNGRPESGTGRASRARKNPSLEWQGNKSEGAASLVTPSACLLEPFTEIGTTNTGSVALRAHPFVGCSACGANTQLGGPGTEAAR